MKFYYDKQEYSNIKKNQNFRSLLVILIISVITTYFYLDFLFIKAITPYAFNTLGDERSILASSEISFQNSNLTIIITFITLIIIGMLIFSARQTITPKSTPKNLSDVVKQYSSRSQIIPNKEKKDNTKFDSIRILLNKFYLDLSWYSISGPHHKWKLKLSLNSSDNKLNGTYKYIADVLLLEETKDNNSVSFNKIILVKELPRHLITINYWIDRLGLSKYD